MAKYAKSPVQEKEYIEYMAAAEVTGGRYQQKVVSLPVCARVYPFAAPPRARLAPRHHASDSLVSRGGKA